MMRSIRTLCLLIAPIVMWGNAACQVNQDTVELDSVWNKYWPTGIRVGTDVIHLVKSQVQNNFHGWEIQGDIDFDRYLLAFEYGAWGRNLNSDSARYANTGRFWRAGIDVNFLTKDPDRNIFFLGARYARSVFSESLSVQRQDPIWGFAADNFYHSDINARWIELTAGLKVKIWKVIWLGYTGRLKFALSADRTEEMLPHDVPGFGSTSKETTWGFNYYVMLRIPIRKAPPLLPDRR